MAILAHFLIGLIFGVGLVIAGMSDPGNVLAFLDVGGIVSGTWNPGLALVLAGAVAVTFVGYRLVLAGSKPLLAESFAMPSNRTVDQRVIVGPAIFGIGWGLSGFCPGPAFTALGFGMPTAFVFVAAMLAGMYAARWLETRQAVQPALTAE